MKKIFCKPTRSFPGWQQGYIVHVLEGQCEECQRTSGPGQILILYDRKVDNVPQVICEDCLGDEIISSR